MKLLLSLAFIFMWFFSVVNALIGDPIPVRHLQGTFRAFLTLKDLDDHLLAVGDLVQIAHGSRVTSRLTFHFRDSSLSDETAVFSQRKDFQLISDHLIQHGPSFPTPLDLRIDTATGTVTTISMKDGRSDTHQEHLDLPPDLYNGLTTLVMLNIDPAAASTRISFLAPGSKPRLVHLLIEPVGDDRAYLAGSPRTLTRYSVRFQIGGLAGAVAPLVGKQPHDMHIWIMPGPAPTLLRQEMQLYEGGPVWRIDQAAPTIEQPEEHAK